MRPRSRFSFPTSNPANIRSPSRLSGRERGTFGGMAVAHLPQIGISHIDPSRYQMQRTRFVIGLLLTLACGTTLGTITRTPRTRTNLDPGWRFFLGDRSEEHTSELQSLRHL